MTVHKHKGNHYPVQHWTRRALAGGAGIAKLYLGGKGLRTSSTQKTLMPRSFTRTKTLGKEKLKGDDVHSGVTDVGYMVKVAEPKKSIDYKAAKNQYHEIVGGLIDTQAGQQVPKNITFIGTTSQWVVPSGTTFDLFSSPKSAVSYFSLNPSEYAQGSAYFGSLFSRSAADKYYLSSCNVKMSVANLANLACSVWIYVLAAKVTHDRSPTEDWSIIEEELGLGKPQANNPNIGFNSGGTVGRGIPNFPGITPTQNSTFKKFWRVLKVHRVNLAGAAQEDVDFHIKMNQLGDMSKIINLNNNITTNTSTWIEGNISQKYLAGSVCIMAISRGAVVNDRTVVTSPTLQNAVTYGSSKVGFVVSKTHNFYPVMAKSNRFQSKAAYPQIPYATLAVNQKMIDTVDNVSGVELA